jgi:hypothetical protein
LTRTTSPSPSGSLGAAVAYLGDPEAGEALVRPLRRAGPLESDSVRPMCYAEVQAMFGRTPSGLRHYWSGRFVRDLPDDALDAIADGFLEHDVWRPSATRRSPVCARSSAAGTRTTSSGSTATSRRLTAAPPASLVSEEFS